MISSVPCYVMWVFSPTMWHKQDHAHPIRHEKNSVSVKGLKQSVCLFVCRATSVSGGAAGPDGDVPLFHHFAAEVSPSFPTGNRPHCHSQTWHDPAAQTILHLRSPQAAKESLFGSYFLSQVAKNNPVFANLSQPEFNILHKRHPEEAGASKPSWCHVAGVEHDSTFNSISSILDARSSLSRYD